MERGSSWRVSKTALSAPVRKACITLPCDPSSNPPVHVLDLETGRDRRLGTLEGLVDRPLGLAVSPDGKTILYPKLTSQNADLMLIENFR